MIKIADVKYQFSTAIWSTCSFVALLWIIKLGEILLGWQVWDLGLYPRSNDGLIGIITAPLIHGSWQHLAGNTVGLMVLGGIMIYGYPKSCWSALVLIWLLSGLGVWLFGRENYHIGASGLTHGMFFYLLTGGILRRDKLSIALLMAAFYMYGGMLMSIFPRQEGISFEYHLFGGIAGALCAIAFRRWDAKPVEKTYDWEGEDEQDEQEETQQASVERDGAEHHRRYVVIDDQWKPVEKVADKEAKAGDDKDHREDSPIKK